MRNNTRHYNIPIFIPHLGCPFHCIFCDQKKISSQKRVPDRDEIAALIEEYLSTIPTGAEVEIAFFGGNFTSIPPLQQRSYLEAVSPYLKSGRVTGIRISTRPDCIDTDILMLLRQGGVQTIELGVQSLSDRVLKASARGYKAEDVFKASRLIKEHRFTLGIQLMIGLPEDSFDQDMQTVDSALSLKPDMVRIYPTLVISGTSLETMYRQGDYHPLGLPESIDTAMHMLLKFQGQDIEVIRMGLHPGEDLRSPGTIVAGPFHPSFGELVEQEIFKKQTEMLAQKFLHLLPDETIWLYVDPRDVSKLVGNRRTNIEHFKQVWGCPKICLKPVAGQERDWVGISGDRKPYPELILTRKDFISKFVKD
ncbi:MAG: elongator complex protein 3 [Syntrophomonadaceae bacterium]|jgi:histone acetyltransferase (RNA polymerase elongator complex component)